MPPQRISFLPVALINNKYSVKKQKTSSMNFSMFFVYILKELALQYHNLLQSILKIIAL